jgi:hypothetical protein
VTLYRLPSLLFTNLSSIQNWVLGVGTMKNRTYIKGRFDRRAIGWIQNLPLFKPTFRTSNWHIEYFNEAIGFPEVADRALSQ